MNSSWRVTFTAFLAAAGIAWALAPSARADRADREHRGGGQSSARSHERRDGIESRAGHHRDKFEAHHGRGRHGMHHRGRGLSDARWHGGAGRYRRARARARQRRHTGGTMVGRMPIIVAGATTEGTHTPLTEVASVSIRMPWHAIAAVEIVPAAGSGTGAAVTAVATAGIGTAIKGRGPHVLEQRPRARAACDPKNESYWVCGTDLTR